MTTTQIERQERTNSRSWRAFGLRAVTIAGFAAAAWLLSGSAAQADQGSQPQPHNVAPVADKASAPLGGLVSTVSSSALGTTSGVLGAGAGLGGSLPSTANQVVPALAQTTQAVISVVTENPAVTGDSSLLDPLSTVAEPVTDAIRPTADSAGRTAAGGMRKVIANNSPLLVPAVQSGTAHASEVVTASAALGGPPAASIPGRFFPELHSVDRDLVIAPRDVASPAPPRLRTTPPFNVPSGPYTGTTGNTGNTGSLPGSQHQDSGSFALVPASVAHGTPFFGVLPVTSFIGVSRDSAADPMISPD